MKFTAFTLILALAFSSAALAQTEKGRWILGAQIGNFTYQDQFSVKSFSGNLTPSAGYFVADGLALGTGIPFSFSTQKGNGVGIYGSHSSGTSIGLAPFVRYFIGKNRLKPYLGVAYSYSKSNSKNTQSDFNGSTDLTSKGHSTAFTPTLGVAYFFTRNLALNAGLNYNVNHQEGKATYTSTLPTAPNPSSYDYSSNTLSLGIGLLIVVGK